MMTDYNNKKISDIYEYYIGLMDKFNKLQESDISMENMEGITDGLFSLVRYIHRDIDIPHSEKEKIIFHINKFTNFIEECVTMDKVRIYITECLKNECVKNVKCIDNLKFIQKLEEIYNKYQVIFKLPDDIEMKLTSLDLFLIYVSKEKINDDFLIKISDIVAEFAGILTLNDGDTDFLAPLYLSQ